MNMSTKGASIKILDQSLTELDEIVKKYQQKY